jgi:hypothetical protein
MVAGVVMAGCWRFGPPAPQSWGEPETAEPGW